MRGIELSGGDIAQIDNEDFDLVSRYVWSLEASGVKSYAVCHLDAVNRNKKLRMHRLIMNAEPHQVVDHIDGDGLNNQKVNLRLCTQGENSRNRRKGRGTSRFIGVSRGKGRRKWRAQIHVGEKVRCLGYFDDEEVAARVYDAAASSAFGVFAKLNFPVHA